MATVLERPVVCKCGLVIKTLEAGKVHYFMAMAYPWWHVRKDT